MEKNSAQKLEWLIEEAVKKGWRVANHNGQHPTGSEVVPGVLKYTSEHIIKEDLALAILANGEFLTALFEKEAREIVARLSSLTVSETQIDFIYGLTQRVRSSQ